MEQDRHVKTTIYNEQEEVTCWGCGFRLSLPSHENLAAFKCGWCRAITATTTDHDSRRSDSECLPWKRVMDRFFVSILIVLMLFTICGGVWSIYPVVFSISFTCGVLHSLMAAILSSLTLITFGLSAFRRPGDLPEILWGSYPPVGEGGLDGYTFCRRCSRPKPPSAHHCRSCGTCVLGMDHHCPFIGNCVGAANHRSFIAYLLSALVSAVYVLVMSGYAASRKGGGFLLSPTLLGSARGIVTVYLFIISVSLVIGLSALLCQQLCFIYRGSSPVRRLTSDHHDTVGGSFSNLLRFFTQFSDFQTSDTRKPHTR